jgi:membrane fusion protein (multidrug efflux system)
MAETDNRVATSGADGNDASKGRSRRTGYIVLIIILAAVAIGVAGYVRLFLTGYQSTDDATVNGNQAVISARTLEQVAQLAAGEGDMVAKGEVIARLDDSILKAQEAQAKVNVSYAEGSVTLAKLKLDQARIDFNRAAVQFTDHIISQEQYDHQKIALQTAQAQYNLALDQTKLARAQQETAAANLARTILTSPIDGVVAKKWVMPGDVVQPAQPIYTLYDLSKPWIEANFKETQIHYLKPGDPATITVDAFPGRAFTGRVETIGAATASEFALIPPQNGSGNFTKVTQRVPVRISIDVEADSAAKTAAAPHAPVAARLLPGMSAEVKVRTGKE